MRKIETALASTLTALKGDIARLEKRAAEIEFALNTIREEKHKSKRTIKNSTKERQVILALESSGSSGLKLRELHEELINRGVEIDKKSVSAYLTRAKANGLVLRDVVKGRWKVA